MTDMIFRRRNLPHQDVSDHPFFITGCLEGSLSAVGLRKIREFQDTLDSISRPNNVHPAEWEHQQQKRLFGFVDDLLDHASPVRHLEDDAQAKIVQDAFLHFADERYQLLAFAVMPSHHHWLFLPDEQWAAAAIRRDRNRNGRPRTAREIISHSIQSYTGTMCNRVRGASGPYWQHETFDHWARDETEMLRIVRYIEMNPVKAGLVATPADYLWSSARIRRQLGLEPGQAIPKMRENGVG